MKPIESVVRSPRWDRQTRTFFFDHLKKPMSDDARLGYCRRKAHFLMGGTKQHQRSALALLTWALDSFAKAKQERGLARAAQAELLEALGSLREAAAAQRAARVATPTIAATAVHEARALLRANKLVATPDVLALERRVTRDTTARAITAYAVWRHAILAFCAAARGEPERSQRSARKALALAAGETGFETWLKRHRRVAIPSLDLRIAEVRALSRLALGAPGGRA